MGISVSEHHVTECAFHNHDAGEKRKMLGGVSFDGGAGSAVKGGSHGVAGVSAAQPPFPDTERICKMQGIRSGQGNATAKAGTEMDGVGRTSTGKMGTDVLNITSAQDSRYKEEAVKENDTTQACQSAAQAVMPNVDKIANMLDRLPAKVKKYLSAQDKSRFGKLQNGIQAFLKGMEHKAGKESRQQPKKKGMTGTRAVTKEEMYDMQVNTAYLLDSYNKYGERSTLGK